MFFPQGSYGATEGNNSGGMRFHQGVVTRVWKVCCCFVHIPNYQVECWLQSMLILTMPYSVA